MTDHIKWPSIEAFHQIRRAVKAYPQICNGKTTVTYQAKCKLHGTNACIQLIPLPQYGKNTPLFEVVAQSRTRIVTPESDNLGFAKWVEINKEDWINKFPAKLVSRPGTWPLKSICYFGEWVGPGTNKGCAIHKIENKIFAIFAMMFVPTDSNKEPEFISEPKLIKQFVPDVPDTYVLPWYGESIDVDWAESAANLNPVVEGLNKIVKLIEECDPWVKDTFNIEGTGEGLVYYPVSPQHTTRKSFSDLSFKAKGEKHKMVKAKEPIQINPEAAASVAEFVELVVTEARLEQGVVDGCGGAYEYKCIGKFIGYVSKDIHKECQAELEASNLVWKQIIKDLDTKIRTWYLHKIEKI